MQIFNAVKLALQKIQKKEEHLSAKLVHKLETDRLPVLLNSFTEIGSTMGILVILAIIATVAGAKPIIFFVPAYFIQLLFVELIKVAINRNRPQTLNRKNRALKLKTTSGSFPSGHTSNIFTLSILLITYFNTNISTAIMLILISVLVGISRLYLGRHYIVDVIGGAIIGTFITTTILWLGYYELVSNLIAHVIY